MTRALLAAAAFVVAAAAPALALRTETYGQAHEKGKPNAVDIAFMGRAHQADDAEIAAARIALSHSRNADVRAFAQRMIDDHTRADRALRTIASKARLRLPGGVDAEDAALAGRLSAERGTAFDRAYAAAQFGDHAKVLRDVNAEWRDTDYPPLRTWSLRAAAIIRAHISLAERLRAAVANEPANG